MDSSAITRASRGFALMAVVLLGGTLPSVGQPLGGSPTCAEPVSGGELVNTGVRTCPYSNCDAIVDGTLLFACFHEEGILSPPSLCAHDLQTRETRTDASGLPSFLDGVTTLEVFEGHAGIDVNDDGDLDDVHLLYRREPRGAWVSTGFEHPPASTIWPFTLHPHRSGALLGFSVREGLTGQDLNGDGDLSDQVIQLHVMGFEGMLNTGVEGWILEIVGPTILIATREFEARGPSETDLNGDGDNDDTILRVLTVELPEALPPQVTGRGGSIPLSRDDLELLDSGTALAYPRVATIAGSLVYWSVSERDHGRDLDGDGVRDDDVLHFVNLERALVENTGVVGFPVAAIPEPRRVALLSDTSARTRALRTWEPETGRLVDHGPVYWFEHADGARVLLLQDYDPAADAHPNLVFDLATEESWFAGFTNHSGAARLTGDLVALHRDGGDCFGTILGAGVEFVDYRRGVWKTTNVAASFYTRPLLRGPVVAFNSMEYLAGRDWDGDGTISWPTAVEVYYVLSPQDWPASNHVKLP